MSREAMQMALEALEQLDGIDTETECVTIDVDDVITALRQALEIDLARVGEVGVWGQCEPQPALEDGWEDKTGKSVDALAVNSVSRFLVRRPHFCADYKIFPTSTGGVLLEFEVNGWDLSLEFLSGGSVEIFGIEIDGAAEFFRRYQSKG
jgi:hypothetical protein